MFIFQYYFFIYFFLFIFLYIYFFYIYFFYIYIFYTMQGVMEIMKKARTLILILVFCASNLIPVCANENAFTTVNHEEFVFRRGDITVKVNGLEMADLSTNAFLYGGGALVDAVALLGNFGAEIAIEDAACQISYLGKTVYLKSDDFTGYVDGEPVTLPVTPAIVDGVFMIPLRFASAAFGFKTEWDEETKTISLEIPIDRQALLDMGKKRTIKIKAPPKTLGPAAAPEEPAIQPEGFTVVIDAGHGAHDSGATGNGILEKDINDDIARRVAELIETGGVFSVKLTKNAGEFLSLGERARVGNEYGDVFVSIHNNSSPGGGAVGTETHYLPHYNDAEQKISCEELARIMQRHLINNLGSFNRGIFVSNFAVLRETTVPAVLLEVGFISNPYEASLLAAPEYRQSAAAAIYNGLLEVYEIYGK
jgi:N-acetylmuramoyl-L-alanine amidase